MIIVRLVRCARRKLIFVVVSVGMDRNRELSNAVFAGDAFRSFFPANDRREKQRGQNTNHRNDNEHFDQREGELSAAPPVPPMC